MPTTNLKAGAIVVLGNALDGAITYSYATVLTVSDYPGEGEAPELGLITIPDPSNPLLSKANWQLAVQRLTDVAHISHPQVKSGARPQFWVTLLPDAGSTPELGSVAADEVPLAPTATSSVLERQTVGNYRFPGELASVASPVRSVVPDILPDGAPPVLPVDITPYGWNPTQGKFVYADEAKTTYGVSDGNGGVTDVRPVPVDKIPAVPLVVEPVTHTGTNTPAYNFPASSVPSTTAPSSTLEPGGTHVIEKTDGTYAVEPISHA